ncbi:MAG TPA: DUF1987 domain-containing protein, partial [Desulfuromonadales bacterium]|nr:DUF1987 domain-containing protein [Desulfuromonadales bacterium]
MEILHIEGTRSTPEIHFDPVDRVLRIAGESYPENSFAFYQPLQAWIAEFLSENSGAVVLNIGLSYLNTGSTKCLLDILDLFEEAFVTGRDITVDWHCDRDNDRAVEAAEEFAEEVTMPFNIIPIN